MSDINIRQAVRRRAQQGFTLLELLVVLAILALLVTIATPQILKYLDHAKVSTAKIQIDSLSSALDLYRLQLGRYPTTDEGLGALITAPPSVSGWSGPYIKTKESLVDPWGHPYGYRSPGEHGEFDLYSAGANGGEAAANDKDPPIKNW